MNVENESIEPVTELGLGLGYSNQFIQRRLNNDSGAGANAGSGINMTFVANNPLSELVWSPHKGPSNVALLPPSTIGRNTTTSTTQKSIHKENSPILNTLQMKIGVVGEDSQTRSDGSDGSVMPVCGPSDRYETAGNDGDAEKMNTTRENDQMEELGESKGDAISGHVESQIAKITENRDSYFANSPGQVSIKNTEILSIKADQPKPDEAQIEASSGKNIDSSNRTMQIGRCVNKTEAAGDLVADQIFQGSRRCLEKMESTSENDLQNLKSEYVCGGAAADEIVAFEMPPGVRGSSQQKNEVTAPTSETFPDQHSPTKRVHMNRRKGKEKTFSDGDFDGIMSKDEDGGNHESVESCNSAGLFPTSKRKRNFEEDLVVGNKGFKKQVHCAQGVTSFTRQDSSFMNWISNMMKGFSKSVQNEAPFPLGVTPHDDRLESPHKKLITLNKNQDSGSKFIGFHSMFQSLYCSKAEVQETRMLNVEYQVGEGSKEFKSSSKTCDVNATPIACHRENSNISKPLHLMRGRFNESTSGNEDSAMQPMMPLDKVAGSQEKDNTNSEDNNSKWHLSFSKEKERTNSNSSLGRQKTISAEKIISAELQPSTAKTSFCLSNDPLGSFWVTRFAPKNLSSSSNMDHLNWNAGVSPKHSTECLKLLEAKVHSSEDLVVVSGKELENSANKVESLEGQNSMYNLNPFLPSTKLKPSDAMATVFARRLDALKHITPSRGTNNSARASMTCLFCGLNDHHLQDCSDITEIELEELSRNVNTYSGIKELSCLCLRCFQRNHWAVACPNTSSTKRLQAESNASFGKLQLDIVNKENLNFLTDVEKNISCTSPVTKHIASNSGVDMLNEKQIIPFSYFVSQQNVDVPKGLFDAVRRLRLSRTNILKWMNSHNSLSRIGGFFLRLRLGKWEEGLGGTGYHVACIVGTEIENKPQDRKSSVLVDVGGFRCLVESQYVSNHDFLEDELMAWWSTVRRSGGEIPSEEDLKTKIWCILVSFPFSSFAGVEISSLAPFVHPDPTCEVAAIHLQGRRRLLASFDVLSPLLSIPSSSFASIKRLQSPKPSTKSAMGFKLFLRERG
ncbi:uncharacterized protein LOC133819046 isoform X3 [Humulus lupulus]|uniref:uncharacterized protein LOC133819046 isoform X3 n=1 Tax=Humulus lupulus TaxID=3486 RepID=UPI002B411E2B|nr:uncharacterized protein LOC133819046 isoform X3 [Humulus lupulus]